MVSGLRGALVLMVALIFFLMIIGVVLLGSVMKPGRWSERQQFSLEHPRL